MKNFPWNYFVLCFLHCNVFQMTLADVSERSGITRTREARKLFGGYRITPKFCKATKTPVNPPGGPNVCMFNHECAQRSGQVVGACMDGFLFGACCQLSKDEMIGDFFAQDYPGITTLDNKLYTIMSTTNRTTPVFDITSNGVSQIAASLLGGHPPFSGDTAQGVLPTGNDNTVHTATHLDSNWATTLSDDDNEIISNSFSSSNSPTDNKLTTLYGDEQTTMRYAETFAPGPGLIYTPVPTLHQPMFRPKPTDNNYVLIPTLSHDKANETDEIQAAINAINSLGPSSTNRPLTTFSFVSSSAAPTRKQPTTSRKPPSTSYVFSTTVSPRRTESTTARKPTRKPVKSTHKPHRYSTTTPKLPSTSYVYSSTFIPTPRPNSAISTSSKPPSTSYVYSSTFKPTTAPRPSSTSYLDSSTFRPSTLAHSTFANSPEAFPESQSTPSYLYSSTSSSSSYLPSTMTFNVVGPGFSVTSEPVGQYSPYPSPAPTVIVLGPVTDEKDDVQLIATSSGKPIGPVPNYQSSTTTSNRPAPSDSFPQRKPINHVTINNHVTQNIYSTQRPQTSSSQNLPSPTVIITPKPTISSSSAPSQEEALESVVVTSPNDQINFPPDRNPNLNISHPVFSDEDITTPTLIEDEAMNEKVELFVNQIIYGFQEPFNHLNDIVYNKPSNGTASPPVNSLTTKKPPSKPSNVKTTTRRPVSTRRPAVSISTASTTTKRPSTTKKVATTLSSYIETETDPETQQSYRDQCGVRPLVRAGRIIGGRGAVFGEFPWQVLVRESTWLGLFTKNKCGGVLISDKYVITAAHCQPGFLASLVAVFGEYDISGDLETRKPISRNVKRVIVHRKYDAATFENDLALLELESPVKFDAHIIPICLPPDNADYTKQMATVTGWGRLKYGGGVPSVLQEVQVPIMENHVCQDMFRTAGHSKVILDSFLCAGYANGQKDACEGDSGGPLVVQRPDGRYELAGTVSHGIKCAAPYLPGVYMRTTYYKPWITSITGLE